MTELSYFTESSNICQFMPLRHKLNTWVESFKFIKFRGGVEGKSWTVLHSTRRILSHLSAKMTNNDLLAADTKNEFNRSFAKPTWKTGKTSINIMVLTVTQEMEEAEDVGSGRGLSGGLMDIQWVTLKGFVRSIKNWMHIHGRHKMGVYKNI